MVVTLSTIRCATLAMFICNSLLPEQECIKDSQGVCVGFAKHMVYIAGKGAPKPRPNPTVAVPSHIAHLRFTPGIVSPDRPALDWNRS